jgi:hypothetical protein
MAVHMIASCPKTRKLVKNMWTYKENQNPSKASVFAFIAEKSLIINRKGEPVSRFTLFNFIITRFNFSL